MADIQIEIYATGQKEDDGSLCLIFNEINGHRIFGMHFDEELFLYLEKAQSKEKSANCDYIHGRLVQIMTERLNAEVEKITIPALENDTFITQVHFKGPAGNFTEDFTASDAITIAVFTGCPIFIEENLFIRAVKAFSSIKITNDVDPGKAN